MEFSTFALGEVCRELKNKEDLVKIEGKTCISQVKSFNQIGKKIYLISFKR